MTDIRTIRESEGEAFLQLLCDVFELDFNRAYDIFFTEPMFDLDRKWALFEGPQMVSILTTTPLEFGWGRAIGIAGVATRKDRQGEGHASRLLQRVLRESKRRGEGPALLFAKELALYERNGFESLDRVVRAPLRAVAEDEFAEPMLFEEVQRTYDAWAAAHPDRLRRDERRWNYWKWHYRVCSPFRDGYVCHEPGVLREAVYSVEDGFLPVPHGTDWFGTTLMADHLGLTFETATVELYLMGKDIPGVPQMFMTDQF
jgi:GNAT superfamily N-acetyltransferase